MINTLLVISKNSVPSKSHLPLKNNEDKHGQFEEHEKPAHVCILSFT